MNAQFHSTIQRSAWVVVFRQKRPINWLTASERRTAPGVICEDGTLLSEATLSDELAGLSSPDRNEVVDSLRNLEDIGVHLELPPNFQAGLQAPQDASVARQDDTDGDSIIVAVRQSTDKARDRMVKKYAKQHEIDVFSEGDIVTVKLPKGTRTSTDLRRIFGKIIAVSPKHTYQIQTEWGIIDRGIPTKELIRPPQAVADLIVTTSWPNNKLALSAIALKASTSDRVIISCKCKGLCNTKRCRCFKENQRCSVYCHFSAEHDCGFLASLDLRTEKALIQNI